MLGRTIGESQSLQPTGLNRKLIQQDFYIASLVGILTALAVYFYSGAASGDDTFIYMRYVENALNGSGFTYNPGESSHGVTSVFWTILMTPVAKVFGNSLETWKVASTALAGLRATFLFILIRLVGANLIWALVLTAICILEPLTFRWSGSGMENSLVVLTLTGLAYFYWKATTETKPSQLISFGLIGGATPFIRPELALLFLGIFMICNFYIFKTFRARLLLLTGAIASAVTGTIFTWVLLNALIPQTAEAKSLILQQADPFYGLVATLKIALAGSLGALILLLLEKATNRELRFWKIVTLFFLVTLVVYLAHKNHLVSTRYAASICSPVVIASALLAAPRATLCGQERKPYFLGIACLSLQLLLSLSILVYMFPATRVSEADNIKKFAEVAIERTDSKARIALTEIGAFGFYSGRYIIDLVALTDRSTLNWIRENGEPQSLEDLEDLLTYRKATHYVETFGGATPIVGKKLDFQLLAEATVERNNFSQGKIVPSIWRLYELKNAPER